MVLLLAGLTVGLVFVRKPEGWERLPPKPNRFFEVMDGADGMGESSRPATAERHVTATTAEHPNVRLQTMTATDGVIFQRPGETGA